MIRAMLIAEAADHAMTTSQLLVRYDELCRKHNVCDNCQHKRKGDAVCDGWWLKNQPLHRTDVGGCVGFERIGDSCDALQEQWQ